LCNVKEKAISLESLKLTIEELAKIFYKIDLKKILYGINMDFAEHNKNII
jgi:hypothetical protein